MTRTCAREIAVRLCFWMSENRAPSEELLELFLEKEYYETLAAEDEAFAEYPDETQLEYIRRLLAGIFEHAPELDGYIEKYAVGWQFSRISRTALAIMRTAMFEVLYMHDVPVNVAVSEAVSLARKYEEPETVPFVNGVLGTFVRSENCR